MLVLTRRIGEGITIGQDIHVKIVAIQGGQIRLGISAPVSVPVHRDEVYAEQQIARQPDVTQLHQSKLSPLEHVESRGVHHPVPPVPTD